MLLAAFFLVTPVVGYRFFPAAAPLAKAVVAIAAGLLALVTLVLVFWMRTAVLEMALIQSKLARSRGQDLLKDIRRAAQCALISRILAPGRLEN